MKKEIKQALKVSLQQTLPILHKLSELHKEPRWVYVQRPNRGGWDGTQQLVPCLWRIFVSSEKEIDDAAAPFLEIFFSTYPEYGEGKLVGISGGAYGSLTLPKSYVFTSALAWIYKRHGSFDCPETQVEQVVNEFEEFVEGKTVRIRMQAKLLNFNMEGDKLALTEYITIRKLSPAEISELHSDDYGAHSRGSEFLSISEFVIELEYEGRKVFSPEPDDSDTSISVARGKLDAAINCLRTFKSGYVGIKWVSLGSVKFCPIRLGAYASNLSYSPPGVYNLAEHEGLELTGFAKGYFGLTDSALLTACARLADSESRLRPQDAILDAVVGMEAILLAGLKKEDRRSELKYRFSIHFGSLKETPEARWSAYKIAKDLYDLRSTIAHGGEVSPTGNRVGNEKLPIREVEQLAKATLRELIRRFLPHSKNAPHKKPDFWESAYFGIQSETDEQRPTKRTDAG